MDAVETVTALAAELGVLREMLHKWRRAHEADGADRLHPIGRPSKASKPIADASPLALPRDLVARHAGLRRWSARIGQQRLNPDFFRVALRQVRGGRLESGASGKTAYEASRLSLLPLPHAESAAATADN